MLRSLGCDVEDGRNIGLGNVKGKEIIEYALKKDRIIITRNVGFGSTLRYPRHPGAIIVRLPHNFSSKQINERLKSFLESIDENRIRNSIIIVDLTRYIRKEITQ